MLSRDPRSPLVILRLALANAAIAHCLSLLIVVVAVLVMPAVRVRAAPKDGVTVDAFVVPFRPLGARVEGNEQRIKQRLARFLAQVGVLTSKFFGAQGKRQTIVIAPIPRLKSKPNEPKKPQAMPVSVFVLPKASTFWRVKQKPGPTEIQGVQKLCQGRNTRRKLYRELSTSVASTTVNHPESEGGNDITLTPTVVGSR